MKKNILNRAMFRQVKSPAYGTGIASNLVSNEQRQRYNSGGRVGFDIGSYPWQRIGSMSDFDYKTGPYMPDVNLSAWNVGPGDPYEVKGDYYIDDQGQRVYDEEKTDFIPMDRAKRLEASQIPYPKIYRDEDYVKSYLASEKAIKRKKALDKEDPTPGYGRTWEKGDDSWRKEFTPIGFADVTVDDSEKKITDMPDPHLRKQTKFEDVIEDGTDELDTAPTAWETLMGELDKSSEEKKKLGRGKALMQAAAAAVKWSGAPTAQKRSEAIAEGLTQVGETGMKTATEGMDLKNRAQILKAMEDVKGGHKMDVWDAKLKEYYGKSITIAQAELKIKQDTLKKLEEGLEPMAIYNEFLRDENKLNIPQLKANELYILTDKKVPVALDDEEEKIYKKPENDGIVFIDRNNKVVRYVDGEKKSVDEKTDEYFTWPE